MNTRPLFARSLSFALLVVLVGGTPACSLWRSWFGNDEEAGQRSGTHIPLRDIENRKIKIGNGDIYCVVGATARGFQAPPIPRGILNPRLLADPELRLLYIIDLGGKIPAAFNSSIRRELAKVLSRERERLELAHQRLGLKRDSAKAINLVFDPDSHTSRLLGIDYGTSAQAVVIFDRKGNRAWSCQGLPSQHDLLKRLSAVKMGLPRDGAGQPAAYGWSHPHKRLERPAAAVVLHTSPPIPADLPPPAPGEPPARSRAESIAKLVPNGRLSRFAETMVIFSPARPNRRAEVPGTIEDRAILSKTRANLIDIPGLNPRRVRLSCEMGVISLLNVPDKDALIAAATRAALAVDGVTEVHVFFEGMASKWSR